MNRALTLDFAFLATEALVLFVVGAILSGAGGYGGPSFLSYLAAEAGGFYLVRGLLRFDLPVRALIGAGGVLSVIALVTIAGLEFDPGSFPPGWAGFVRYLGDPAGATSAARAPLVFGLVLFVVAWGRGVMMAQQRLERGTALRSFSAGLVALVGGLLFGEDSHARGAVNAASIPLVALALLTLALIHLRDGRPSATAVTQGPWLLITVGTIGFLALAGVALGVLPLGPMGFVYDHAVGPALELALTIVAWIVIVIAYPFAWLISAILGSLVHNLQFKPPPPQQTSPDQAKKLLEHQGGVAGVFVVLFKLLAIVALVAIAAYIAYRLFRRLHRPPNEDEDRDSLRHEGSVMGDLAALWRSLRPRRPGLRHGPPEPALPAGVLEVRRLYLRLLERAATRGRPRPSAATPDEYEPVLEQVLRSPVPAHLTEAFTRARYGLVAPPPTELADLRDELKRLE